MRLFLFILATSALAILEVAAVTPEQSEFFETKVRPVLAEHCYKCHSAKAEKLKAELYLDSRAGMLKGGELGPAINLEKPEDSLLLKAIGWKERDLQMPPRKALPRKVVEDFNKWVNMGAPWPGDQPTVAIQPKAGFDFEVERKSHWAWKKVQKSKFPEAAKGREIDYFIEQKMKEKELAISPEAPAHTLIRRVNFDMIGLPPTPAQTEEFVSGKKTWDEVVEELLASPHYGVRWGRHWLDVARFADGYGGFLDAGKFDSAWQYRDWVISALNTDMPYNDFLRFQLAGDILAPKEHAVATGFLALGPQYRGDGGDAQSNAIAKSETLDDRVDTVGRGLLGLTLACSRCHDHKFDPIPMQDYYSLAGVFQNTSVGETPMVPQEEVDAYNAKLKAIQDYRKETDEMIKEEGLKMVEKELPKLALYMVSAVEFKESGTKERLQPWARQKGLAGGIFNSCLKFFTGPKNTSKLPAADAWFTSKTMEAAKELQTYVLKNREAKEVKDFLNRGFKYDRNQIIDDFSEKLAEEVKFRRKEHSQMEKDKPKKYPYAHVLRESGSRNMKVALRGNLLKPGPEAPRRFLKILDDEQSAFSKGSGRQELAEKLIDPTNPLTARVFVNRVWGWHFGKNLVKTPSNFGKLGNAPTHPQLLDWLAATFVEEGWSIKDLHRKILTSQAWKQSSQFDEAKFTKDGDNVYLWRMNPRKLEAEVWRDAVLAVSGKLDPTIGGKPFDDPSKDFRRTIHARSSRNGDQFPADQFLRLFDFPVPRASVARRTPSITPQQSLFMLNNPFVTNQAKALAAKVKVETEKESAIQYLYQMLFARNPTPQELAVGTQFLEGKDAKPLPLTREERYAQALLASAEFLFIE